MKAIAECLARDPMGRFGSASQLAVASVAAGRSGNAPTSFHDESAIRQAFETGDMAAATTAALKQFGPEVLGYLSGCLGDSDLARDAFSDFSVRVWSSLPRFEWRSSFRTWAYALARRAASDIGRARRREGRHREPLSDRRLDKVVEHVHTETPPSLRKEGWIAVARLRDELPSEDKMLFVLRAERGLAWKQVARAVLENPSPDEGDLLKESGRLRKRYELMKKRLRKRVCELGLVEPE